MKAIPKEVREVVKDLERGGYEAFIVGGCVRDLLLGREPKDWDVATSGKPEEVQKLFPDSFYENRFFTVTVLKESRKKNLKEIEVTTYRSESGYADYRRPDEVKAVKTIEEDLSRRDFAINAMALRVKARGSEMIDPFGGQADVGNKIIRAVGKPKERFEEDALRMMRAVRLASELGFEIESETRDAISISSHLLEKISAERIRDEFCRILMSDLAMEGVELLRELGLLRRFLPELEEGYGVGQNKHHVYTVWEHNLLALQYACGQKWSLEVRLASLLHDVAKPRVKNGDGYNSTFYNHEVEGGKMAKTILNRLKFSKKQVEKISKLVRFHLFYYNVDEVSESSVRRLVRNVGAEDMDDLLRVRMADRIGSGVPKAEPYKLRHLKYLIEKVSQDPISVSRLKIRGERIMELLKISPGPQVGQISDILLSEVVENPKSNTVSYLEQRIAELSQLSGKELSQTALNARSQVGKLETKSDEMIKQKYWVS